MQHLSNATSTNNQEHALAWFNELREELITTLLELENEYCPEQDSDFNRQQWHHHQCGGGEIGLLKGKLFEKAGVNISAVKGSFTPEFAQKIPGANHQGEFFACGVSVVIHPRSPKVPISHFNTRFIVTDKQWFGGGGDLTPIFPDAQDTKIFHHAFKSACDRYNLAYYPKFKKWCDEYFYIKHRHEPRGVGGIFYDYIENNFDDDFAFTQDVGRAFLKSYPAIVRRHYRDSWDEQDIIAQKQKRARYVEFNLLYDRGTKFGLETGGNVDAILMSLPPSVGW